MKRISVVACGILMAGAAFASSCIVSGSIERNATHSDASVPSDQDTIVAANGNTWFGTSEGIINFLARGLCISIW